MRLTADILLKADSYINACKERELSLRGFKIPAIENLGVLQDQYDTIDVSDNEIKKLDNFPVMKRLSTVIANNNYVSRVGSKLGENLVGITALVLTNNRIVNMCEIDNIATLKKLEHLSLLDNAVSQSFNYRLYAIFRIPTLKSLDYRKVTKAERENAASFFKSSAGLQMLAVISSQAGVSSGVSEGGGGKAPGGTRPGGPLAIVLTDFQKAQVKAAIEAASTKEQIDDIEHRLKTGTFEFSSSGENGPLNVGRLPDELLSHKAGGGGGNDDAAMSL